MEDYKNPQQGGGGAAFVRIIFKDRGAGGSALRIGDLGGQPPHRQVPGGVSVTGGETVDGMDTTEDNRR